MDQSPSSNKRTSSTRQPDFRYIYACFALSLAMVIEAKGSIDGMTLEREVATSKAILRVSIIAALPPLSHMFPFVDESAFNPNRPGDDDAVFKAKVLEVLKGPADLKEIEFRCGTAKTPLAGGYEKLQELTGKEYYVFLRPLWNRTNEWYHVASMEGSRPGAGEDLESRSLDGRIVTFSRTNYVAKIRAFLSQPK